MVDFPSFPDDLPDNLRALARAAFAAWAPDCASVLLKPITQGYSGSALAQADVRSPEGSALLAGQYILKVSEHLHWKNQDSEIEAFHRAYNWNPEFSREHLPHSPHPTLGLKRKFG